MSTKSFQPTATRPTIRNSKSSLWGWLGLSLLLAVFAIYGWMAPRTEEVVVTSSGETARSALVARLDPAAESVMAYIRAHEVAQPAIFVDPAAQSVLNYIRAHEVAQPVVFVDPAAQSVLNYIRAHDSNQVVPRDPNAESVLNYLRAHDD